MDEKEYYHDSVYDLYLAESQIKNAGLGVWTRETIVANSYIDDYDGQVYTYNPGGSYILEITDKFYIDGEVYPRSYTAMLNDASYVSPVIVRKKKKKVNLTPKYNYDKNGAPLVNNCIFRIDKENKRGMIYSIMDIAANTELFISYGENYWN
jgi:hypothetical protein